MSDLFDQLAQVSCFMSSVCGRSFPFEQRVVDFGSSWTYLYTLHGALPRYRPIFTNYDPDATNYELTVPGRHSIPLYRRRYCRRKCIPCDRVLPDGYFKGKQYFFIGGDTARPYSEWKKQDFTQKAFELEEEEFARKQAEAEWWNSQPGVLTEEEEIILFMWQSHHVECAVPECSWEFASEDSVVEFLAEKGAVPYTLGGKIVQANGNERRCLQPFCWKLIPEDAFEDQRGILESGKFEGQRYVWETDKPAPECLLEKYKQFHPSLEEEDEDEEEVVSEESEPVYQDDYSLESATRSSLAPADAVIGTDVESGEPVALPYPRRDRGVAIIEVISARDSRIRRTTSTTSAAAGEPVRRHGTPS